MSSILDVCDKLVLDESNSTSIDFIGRGNIWINNTYNYSVVKLAQQIIINAITNTAPGQLSIVGYDDDLSGVFAPFSALSAGESRILEIISDKKVTQIKIIDDNASQKAYKELTDYLTDNNINFFSDSE